MLLIRFVAVRIKHGNFKWGLNEVEESDGENRREPGKRPLLNVLYSLVFTECNNPVGKKIFPLQYLDDSFFCYYSSLSDLILFQALSWSGRRKLRWAREKVEQRLSPARAIPLSLFLSTLLVPSSFPCELMAWNRLSVIVPQG